MNVTHYDEEGIEEYVSIRAKSFTLIVSERDDHVSIYLADHLHIKVYGKVKNVPRIEIRRDEFESELDVKYDRSY